MTMTLIQCHKDTKKVKTSEPIISQSYEWIFTKFGQLLRLDSLTNLIASSLISIQGWESNLGYFILTQILACIQTFTDQFIQTWYDDRHY